MLITRTNPIHFEVFHDDRGDRVQEGRVFVPELPAPQQWIKVRVLDDPEAEDRITACIERSLDALEAAADIEAYHDERRKRDAP